MEYVKSNNRTKMKSSILTASGSYFDFLKPEESKITIEDIAHALSHLCRFTGHTQQFYSVAQHSIHCSYIVPPEDAMEALMHDAAEAFVGGMASPLKRVVGDAFLLIEQRVEREIAKRFNLRFPWPQSVKDADLAMLATERRYLMHPMHPSARNDLWDCGDIEPRIKLVPMQFETACYLFLERYHELNTLLARNPIPA